MRGELVQARAVLKYGQLSIRKARRRDSGLYKCQASNKLGQDSAVSQLVVVKLPRFTVTPPAQLEVDTTRNITVPCQATGGYRPEKLIWMKHNSELPFGRSQVSEDGTLHIWNPTKVDSGIYTCVALLKTYAKAIYTKELIVNQGW